MMNTNLQNATYVIRDEQDGFVLDGAYQIDGSQLITSVNLDAFTSNDPKTHCGNLRSDCTRLQLTFPKGADVLKVTSALLTAYETVTASVGEKEIPINSQTLK